MREVAIYAAGAGAAFAVDAGLLAFQVEVLGVHYLIAAAIAFLAGTLVVYWASTRYAFRYRRLADHHSEFGIFAAVGVLGIAVNVGIIYLAVDKLGLHYLVGKVFAGAFTFGLNFALRRLMLFTPWRRSPINRMTEG